MATTYKSGYEIIVFEEDLVHIYKQAIGIVLGFNKKNHYVPTQYISHAAFNKYQIRNIRHLTLEVVDMTKSLVQPKLTKPLKDSVAKMQKAIEDFLELTKDSKADQAGISTSAYTPVYGPILPDPVPDLPGEQELPPLTLTKSKKKPKVYKCNICGITKTKSNDLKDHKVSQHSKQKFLCEFCQKPFSYLKNKKSHIKSKHKGEYLYSCSKDGNKINNKLCSYKKNGKEEYKVHCVKYHSQTPPEKKYPCSKCGKKFLSKLQLRKHTKHGMCTLLKNFICEDCDPPRGFKKMLSLQKHQNVFHKNTIAKQECPQCKKKFGSLNSEESFKVAQINPNSPESSNVKEKREDDLKKKAAAVRRSSSRMPYKSAPAKLLPMRRK